jgi:serine/threonine protein kinase
MTLDEEVDLGIPGIGPATLIGRGGFGRVYRAVQTATGSEVAVKLVAGHLEEHTQQRFEREARALGALRGHPNICTVFDAGVDADGRPYLVMERAATTLAQQLDESGAMAWDAAATLVVQLAGALHTAHANRLLHRDVKPENVLITPYREPKLADFGLARFTDDTLSRGVITTTIAHAAPELIRGDEPTVATDVYALGSTLFCALTGHVAFGLTGSALEISRYRRIEEDPVPEMPGVPEPIADVVRTAMAKRPEERFASAGAMGEALRDAQRALGVQETPMAVMLEPPQPRTPTPEPKPGGTKPPAKTGNPTRVLTGRGRPRPKPPGTTEPEPEPDLEVDRRPYLAALAVLALVVVVIGAVALSGTGDGDDRKASDTTTTIAPGSPDAIGGRWSLTSARFSESSFCDADTCNELDSLSIDLDCEDFSGTDSCGMTLDGTDLGYLRQTSETRVWIGFVYDAQGPGQLKCGEDPAETDIQVDLVETSHAADGTADTLEGTYRSTLALDAPCGSESGEYVEYEVVMGR